MTWKSILLAIAFLAATGCAAFAGADDYVFEPVNAEIKSSNVATSQRPRRARLKALASA
jgi:hypothetical protein